VDVRTDFVLEGGKKRQRRIAVAAEDRKLAELNFRESLRNLILDVQSAYTDVLLRKETLRLAEENRQNFNSLLAINQSRVTAGDLAAVELDRSKIAALQLENAFRQAQLDLAQARLRLQQVLGRRNPVDDFDVEGDFRRDAFPASLNELVNMALERRPDLAAGRELYIRNQADARLQIANGKIDYTIGTEYRRQYGVTSYGSSVALFLQAPIPVFNRNQGEIARAQRESDQTKFRIESLTNRIQAEVRSAWQQYETAKDLLTRIEGEMLTRASQVRQTTEYSYRRGEASLVELLDAQRAFNDTRQSYNEARANYTRSLFLMDAITAKTVTEGGFK
jgi:cobalt-zinc-cadmium efflux system outer membrane protein